MPLPWFVRTSQKAQICISVSAGNVVEKGVGTWESFDIFFGYKLNTWQNEILERDLERHLFGATWNIAG